MRPPVHSLVVVALPLLSLVFAVSACAVWLAGTRLADSTDVLVDHFGIGEAFGGLVLLAVVTDLPEIAIVVSGAQRGDLSLITGNLLGGVAMQTFVLVALDAAAHTRGRPPLTSLVGTLTPVLEGALVVTVLVIAIMATQLDPKRSFARIDPSAATIAIAWLVGLAVIRRTRDTLPWRPTADTEKALRVQARASRRERRGRQKLTPRAAMFWFALTAFVTLAAGTALEISGEHIASDLGINGAIFGATILAAATSLPELSTGVRSVQIGDYELAISDIFGGDAFLPVLFVLAGLVAGRAVLPHANPSDVYISGLGIFLTVIYMAGLVIRPARRVLGVGLDSLAVGATFIAGTIALTFVR